MLENAGSAGWRDVFLGYHWLDALGNPIVWEPLRTPAPYAVLDSLPLLSEERERERRAAASGPRVAVHNSATPPWLHEIVARWGAEVAVE